MPRLPQPGGDAGQWGSILNEFLTTAHNTDGTLKAGVVTEANLDSTLTAKVNDTAATDLAGDVTGTLSATVVSAINGVAISGAPTAGQIIKATGPTAAGWGTDDVSPPVTRTVVTASSNTTAEAGNVVLASGAITVTLPAAANGAIVSVKKVDAASSTVTVAGAGSALIDGSATWVANEQWTSGTFVSNGTDWFSV